MIMDFLESTIGPYNVFTYLFLAVVSFYVTLNVKRQIRMIKEDNEANQTWNKFKQKNREMFTKKNFVMVKKYYLKKFKNYFLNKK